MSTSRFQIDHEYFIKEYFKHLRYLLNIQMAFRMKMFECIAIQNIEYDCRIFENAFHDQIIKE